MLSPLGAPFGGLGVKRYFGTSRRRICHISILHALEPSASYRPTGTIFIGRILSVRWMERGSLLAKGIKKAPLRPLRAIGTVSDFCHIRAFGALGQHGFTDFDRLHVSQRRIAGTQDCQKGKWAARTREQKDALPRRHGLVIVRATRMPADPSPTCLSSKAESPCASITILGVPVAAATYDSALERVKILARQARPTAVCPANTHILAEARHNPEFANTLAKFDLVLPDGMPVVWALNRAGAKLTDRVYGPYFMRHTLRNTPRPWRHFFFGDSEACLADLQKVAKEIQPEIEIAGAISPPFRALNEADEDAFAAEINRAEPDFVWVALPGVRMERWIVANQKRYKRGVFLAVGDAFTLLTGRRAFAPPWMQRAGLTWVYRLLREPGRLGPRYLRYNALYLYYTFLERPSRRSASPA